MGFAAPLDPLTPTSCAQPGSVPGVPGKKDPNVTVHLDNDDLWKEFHGIGTEMIITKSGR